MNAIIPQGAVLNAIVFSILGIVILVVSFIVIDKLTPYKLWDEVVKQKNVALSILLGAICISIAIIISAAVHG